MRGLKIVGIAVLALVALGTVSLLAVLILVNPNAYRGDIERLAAQKTGRTLQIGGRIDLKFFPWLALAVTDVKLGNPRGFGPEPFLTVQRASVGVKLLPILRKRLEVSRVAVEGLTITLVSRGPTNNNWKDLVDAKAQERPADDRPAGSAVQATIAGVDVRNATLIYRDDFQKSVTALAKLQAQIGSLGGTGPVPVAVEFDYSSSDAGKAAASHVAVVADVEMPAGSRQVRLSKLDVAVVDIHVRGSAAVDDLDKMAVSFDLASDAIDLDRLMASTDSGAAATARPSQAPATAPLAKKPPIQLPVEALRKLDAHGTLRMRSVTVERMLFTGVTLPLAAEGGRVHLGPVQAGLFGGRYDGDILLDVRAAEAQVSLKDHIKDVDNGALLNALAGSRRIVGRADANLAVTGVGNTDAALFHSLNGKLDVTVRNGALDGIDLWYELSRAQALLKRETVPVRTGSERTPFNALRATGTIDNGVMHNDDLRLETDYLKVRGRGTLDLDTQAIDYHVIVEVDKLPPTGAGAGLADLKAAEIPVSLTGSLKSPQVRPDLQALAESKVRQEVNKRLQGKQEELKKKLGDKLLDLFGH
ncbi:MAG: hypothetical protein JWM63_199 [Gammaproteobacteria bacterium]|jgi:AsmA protein|nr:hypothetical protein [Gammaproteobacteria bacterium]